MAADIDPLADSVGHVEVHVFIGVVTFACGAEMTANAPILSAHGAVQVSLASRHPPGTRRKDFGVSEGS